MFLFILIWFGSINHRPWIGQLIDYDHDKSENINIKQDPLVKPLPIISPTTTINGVAVDTQILDLLP
jgi:hypothetical protein